MDIEALKQWAESYNDTIWMRRQDLTVCGETAAALVNAVLEMSTRLKQLESTVVQLPQCSICGATEGVEEMEDPYQKEMFDEIVIRKLCPECAQNLRDDV